MNFRPGNQLARRRLHFFLVADCSGSMAADGKIRALNTAVREMLPHLVNVSTQNPHAELVFSTLAFSSGVRWHIDPARRIDEVVWSNLAAGGYTDMGHALRAIAERVAETGRDGRCMAPAIVLVSDGQPTDDFEAGLETLLNEPLGNAAARIAVAIGRDVDRDVLVRFQGGGEPLLAHNPEQLVSSLRWASTAATRAASELVAVDPSTRSRTSHDWLPPVPHQEDLVW